MGLILFTLTMPNKGSWDGKWSGEGKFYGIVKNISKEDMERILLTRNYHYRWDDGWSVSIYVEKIDGKDRRKYEKKSEGFCGYEWMIDSIIKNNTIIIEGEL